jgi:parallel beta-helix repeat protein
MLGYGKDEHGRWVSPHFAWGVYLDDNTGGVDVVGNIVARCPRAGIHLHNGRDNHIENNCFIDATLQQIECNGWTPDSRMWNDHLPTMIKGWEMVCGQPAWQAMRNMGLDPRDAPLPDGTIMSGNQFFRNIVSYREPKAKYFNSRSFSLEHNQFDSNLVWHCGAKILTGCRRPGRDLTANLVPNANFSEGVPGKLPADWKWQIRPRPSATALLVTDEEGRRALRIDAAFVAEKPRDNYPIVVSKDLSLPAGPQLPPPRLDKSQPGQGEGEPHAPVLCCERLFLGQLA